jgi:hypothetical protein
MNDLNIIMPDKFAFKIPRIDDNLLKHTVLVA